MPLTVRLDPSLDAALATYCEAHGVSKSLVVQESLARYLVQQVDKAGSAGQGRAAKGGAAAPAPVSSNLRAFEAAGLVGSIAGLGLPADKAQVRAMARPRKPT
jgi:predicted transcriptional regulator